MSELNTPQHTIECCDSWLRVTQLPTYSELLAALEDLVTRCDSEEGVRADGSNIQTYQGNAQLAKARAILAKVEG